MELSGISPGRHKPEPPQNEGLKAGPGRAINRVGLKEGLSHAAAWKCRGEPDTGSVFPREPIPVMSHPHTDEQLAARRAAHLYLFVGLILFFGTITTWAVATLPQLDFGKHGFDAWDCVIGLCIASIKASLVAAVYMHLNHEKRTVYMLIGIGVVMVTFLAVLLALADHSRIVDPLFYR